MKKILSLAVLLVVAAVFVSCGKSRLAAAVEKANKDCPVSLGMMGEMTSMEMVGDDVMITYSLDESLVNISFIASNKEMLKDNAMEMFSSPKGDLKTVLEELSRADAGLVLRFVGRDSEERADIRLDSKEIKLLLDGDVQKDPHAVLKGQVDITNKQCPMKIETGMTITHLTLEDGCVVYNVECDENLYSIAQIRANIVEARESIVEALKSDDPSVKVFVDVCKEAHCDIAYRYVGDSSGDTCLVKVSCDEL